MERNYFHEISRYLQLHRGISLRYDQYLTAAARSAGLTRPEADVLLFLANNPQFHTARDVAVYRGFSKTYVSKALDRLGTRALVTAEADSADRRRQNLRLTAAAAEPVQQLQAAQRSFFRRLTAGVSPADVAVLRRMARQVQKNLESL